MPTFPFRWMSALPRRLLETTRPRQLVWRLRRRARCLIGAAARPLSLAASRRMRRTRRRLLALRRIWLAPNYLAVVILARRSPRPRVRIRWLTCPSP